MPTKRIAYIDALRGFTMILVVMNHVTSKCFGAPFWSLNPGDIHSYAVIFREFRMPLFFFISGFVLFKPTDKWEGKHIVSFFKKKIPVQLLSPLVFFLAYLFVNHISLHDGFFSTTKNGYWFTFTLLEFYLFYAIARYACLKLKFNSLLTDILLLLYGVAFIGVSKLVLRGHPISGFLGMGKWYLFVYMVIGTLVRKHFESFEQLLDKGTIVILSVILFIGLNLFYSYLPLGFAFYQILSLTGIIIVFALFRKHGSKSYSSKNEEGEKLSDIQQFKRSPLQFIGRRTLDIYLLHFFIIPIQLSEFFTLFSDHAIPVIELACSLLISIIVIFVCLIIGEIIRLNPQMAHWVFGARIEQKND